MLNRTALIFRPQLPFIDWVRAVEDDETVPRVDYEQMVYLIPDFDDDSGFQRILNEIWEEIFERNHVGMHRSDDYI